MSQPSFPIFEPLLSREDSLNQIIVSLAQEELGLSHIMNGEGEKIQFVLGTLPGLVDGPATLEEIIDVGSSLKDVLEGTISNQTRLKKKLKNVLAAPALLGPIGAIGEVGPDRPTDATGPNSPDTAGFAVNTMGSAIAVLLGGTNIALPNAQLFFPDISVSGANTVFTVNTAGIYRVFYQVNTAASLFLGTRLMINGSAFTPSVIPPTPSLANFKNEVVLLLTVPSTISLQLFGLLGAAALLPNGTGATLMIIRLS